MAAITVENGGKIVRGSYQPGQKEFVTIHGRYEISDSRTDTKRKNALGDEIKVTAEFYTPHGKIVNATRIVVESLGVDAPVICWDSFQSYSVISL